MMLKLFVLVLLCWETTAAFHPTRRLVQQARTISRTGAASFVVLSRHDRRWTLSTSLEASASEDTAAAATSVNWGAILKYMTAVGIQMGILTSLCTLLDRFASGSLPFGFNVALFWLLSLKSRVFNPLSNNRPNRTTMEAANRPKRKLPSWTPPGIVFPIMWILIIAPLRATSSALVIEKSGKYLSTLPLLLHLSIGDVWNTINNVEQRFGVSVSVVCLVWLSNALAAYQYFQIHQAAGKLLALPLFWLTIATTLIVSTWRLNKNENNKLAPLYPTTDISTNFKWFSSI